MTGLYGFIAVWVRYAPRNNEHDPIHPLVWMCVCVCARVCVCDNFSLGRTVLSCVCVCFTGVSEEGAGSAAKPTGHGNERHVLTLKLQYEGPRTRVVYPKIKYSKLPKWGEICVG